MSLINLLKDFIVLPWEKPLQRDANNQIIINLTNLAHISERIRRLSLVIAIATGILIPPAIVVGVLAGKIVLSPAIAIIGLITLIILVILTQQIKMNQEMKTFA